MKLDSGVASMLTELFYNLIFMFVLIALFFLLAMASEANNRTMTRVWGSAMGLVILIYLTH
jgi:hypothetical protein